MKRIIKSDTSEIVTKDLKYPKHAAKIRELLEGEHEGFCAYIEERFSYGYARDVEHFNESLKYQPTDNYYNWYAVSHKVNNKKKRKFADYQPILLPYAEDFEERIFFNVDTYTYDYASTDVEAKNLVDFLDLNNHELVKYRQKYIEQLKLSFKDDYKEDPELLKASLVKYPLRVQYRRAIEAVFTITI